MATFNKFNSFIENCCEKIHDLSADTLAIALCAAANAPVATNTVLANLTQIAYTNLTGDGTAPGGRGQVASSSGQAPAGTYKLVLVDRILTASGLVATFRYVVLYNDTPTTPLVDPLIAWWDYGSDVTLNSGETFTVDFDATNGVLQIT